MRMLLKIRFTANSPESAVRDGTVERLIKQFISDRKPEAAYFFADEGRRSASFVFDLDDSAQIPAISEPWATELSAEVRMTPVMNLDDLQRGLSALAQQG